MKKTLLIMILAVLGVTQAMAQENDYLPIVREGVKWVNEKVIVNQGDTTSYYYIYEFSGEDLDGDMLNILGEPNKACYYYTGNHLDVEKDSLIAGLTSYDVEVECTRNNAYDKMMNEDRVMFPLSSYVCLNNIYLLYRFRAHGGCLEYYFTIQDFNPCDDVILTEDNFVKISPLMIEGVECQRFALLGEHGDTICCFVEGIGFDSYDMGDLLTPFTRKPDPEADYQEWCGLSHVIKDGQIIYKGMRYRDDSMTAIDEVVADKTRRPLDPRYYDLMGRALGTEVPTTPGIYIHQGKKIMVR